MHTYIHISIHNIYIYIYIYITRMGGVPARRKNATSAAARGQSFDTFHSHVPKCSAADQSEESRILRLGPFPESYKVDSRVIRLTLSAHRSLGHVAFRS